MSTHETSLSLSRFSRRSLLIGGSAAALTLTAFPRSGVAQYPGEPAYAHPEWLIDAASLRQQLGSVKVIALTPIADFETGHIPGAAQLDWPALLVGHSTPDALDRWQASVQEQLRDLNVTPGDSVVVYDGGSFLASRFWWSLDTLGHKNVRILNGGLAAWKAATGEIETGAARVESTADLYAGALNTDRLATQGEVMMALGDDTTVLLDARDAAEFQGGHIPGAMNYHFMANADGGPVKVFKTVDHLTAAYTALGITPDKHVIVYCSTGTRSCSSYFTLRLIGYPDVRVYAGAWEEWAANPYTPREVGAAKASVDSVIPQHPAACARCTFNES